MNLLFSSVRKVTWKKKEVLSHLFLTLENLNEVKFLRLLVAPTFTLQLAHFASAAVQKFTILHLMPSAHYKCLQYSKKFKMLNDYSTQEPTDPVNSALACLSWNTITQNSQILICFCTIWSLKVEALLVFIYFHQTFVFLSFPLQSVRSEILTFVKRSQGKIFSNKLVSSEVLANPSKTASGVRRCNTYYIIPLL